MISNSALVLLLAFMCGNMVYGWGYSKSSLFLLRSNCYTTRQYLLTRHSPSVYCNAIHASFGSRQHNKERRETISNLAKYRQTVVALYQSRETEIAVDTNKAYYVAAEQAVILLAQKSRTWKRLAHIVELSTSTPRKYEYRTIADIGCDHGLLSIALASTGKFQKVTGIDVSDAALENGAKKFYSKALHAIGGLVENQCLVDDPLYSKEVTEESSKWILPVEFRIGDGLSPLKQGEADAICMAGMGVDTMLYIIGQALDNASNHTGRVLDSLHCNSLFLQPPNSRPRKLMELYENVHKLGFTLTNERIMKLKERYYITSHFDRNGECFIDAENVIPGSYLFQSPDVEQRNIYREFVDHHYRWLEQDFKRNGDLWDYDKLWIERHSEWNMLSPRTIEIQ